jgi:hypothetical protein
VEHAGRDASDVAAAQGPLSVAAVWLLLLNELRHGHATRKTKSLGMAEGLLKARKKGTGKGLLRLEEPYQYSTHSLSQ